MMLMRLYPILFHLFSGMFLGRGILLSIAAHFKSNWAREFVAMNGDAKKWAIIWSVLFLPLIFMASSFYPWQDLHGSKKIYFGTIFVLVRLTFYVFGSLWAINILKSRPSLSLILFIFISSFFAIDWGMSLEAGWFSNLYSFHYMTNAALGAFALFIFRRSFLISREALEDVAHMLLTICMVGIYLHYAQYIIFWMANHPAEVRWYLLRNNLFLKIVNVLMHTLKFLPIFIICFQKRWKCNPALLKMVSLAIIVGYILEVIWFIGPSLFLK